MGRGYHLLLIFSICIGFAATAQEPTELEGLQDVPDTEEPELTESQFVQDLTILNSGLKANESLDTLKGLNERPCIPCQQAEMRASLPLACTRSVDLIKTLEGRIDCIDRELDSINAEINAQIKINRKPDIEHYKRLKTQKLNTLIQLVKDHSESGPGKKIEIKNADLRRKILNVVARLQNYKKGFASLSGWQQSWLSYSIGGPKPISSRGTVAPPDLDFAYMALNLRTPRKVVRYAIAASAKLLASKMGNTYGRDKASIVLNTKIIQDMYCSEAASVFIENAARLVGATSELQGKRILAARLLPGALNHGNDLDKKSFTNREPALYGTAETHHAWLYIVTPGSKDVIKVNFNPKNTACQQTNPKIGCRNIGAVDARGSGLL